MIVRNRRRFYEDYRGSYDVYSESLTDLPIRRCRTSNPSVFHSVSNGNVNIFEDIRYYEYVVAVGSGFFDLYYQKNSLNINSRNVVTILSVFAREILMDCDPDYALDIVYLDLLEPSTKGCFSDIKNAMSYKQCKSWSEYFLRMSIPGFVIQHETFHFRRYINTGEDYSEPLMELMAFANEITKNESLSPLRRYAKYSKYALRCIEEHFEMADYFEEILCDLRAARRTLIYAVNGYVNSHGGPISESRFNSIVAAFLAIPHIIQVLELARMNTFEETPDEIELIRWSDLFNGRKIFLFIMICKMIHKKEIFLPENYNMIEHIIRMEDAIKNISRELRGSISYCVSPKMISKIHNNIKHDMPKNGYGVDRCIDLVRKNWSIQ